MCNFAIHKNDKYDILAMEYNDFKKMDFYKAFEGWFYSEIANDYYFPEQYSDDGELIEEASFDEEGCSRTVETTIKAAVLVYNQLDQNPNKLRDKSIDDLLQMAGLSNDGYIYYIGLYCGLFLCALADYKNYRHSLKGVVWRAFVGVIDSLFIPQDKYIWLQFYAQFSRYHYLSLLPDKLKDEKVMKYWHRLQEKGIVDGEYQIIYKKGLKNYHVAIIANEFRWKTNSTWEDFEKHFRTRSGKPFANLRAEDDISHRRDKDTIWEEIEECFR